MDMLYLNIFIITKIFSNGYSALGTEVALPGYQPTDEGQPPENNGCYSLLWTSLLFKIITVETIMINVLPTLKIKWTARNQKWEP